LNQRLLLSGTCDMIFVAVCWRLLLVNSSSVAVAVTERVVRNLCCLVSGHPVKTVIVMWIMMYFALSLLMQHGHYVNQHSSCSTTAMVSFYCLHTHMLWQNYNSKLPTKGDMSIKIKFCFYTLDAIFAQTLFFRIFSQDVQHLYILINK